MGSAKAVGTADFDTEVLGAQEPVLVDFWADWCGPCRMVSPVVEEIANEQAGKMKVVKVDIEEAPELAQRYSVFSIPTLILFKQGEIAKRMVGAKGKTQLLGELLPHIA